MNVINKAKTRAQDKAAKTGAGQAANKLGAAFGLAFTPPPSAANLAGGMVGGGGAPMFGDGAPMGPAAPMPRPRVQQLPPPQHMGTGSVFDGLEDFRSTVDFFGNGRR